LPRRLGCRPIQPQFAGNRFHGFDAESDVRFEIHAEVGRAFDDVFAVDAAGEGFVLHFLAHALGFDFGERFSRLDESAGSDEAGEFIAGEEGLFHRREARHAAVLSVRHDGAAHFF
jgi:hypothetical protein